MVANEKGSLVAVVNFFVLPILFPPQIWQTMEFIFKCFYKYPESERDTKRNIINIQKITTLIKKWHYLISNRLNIIINYSCLQFKYVCLYVNLYLIYYLKIIKQ